MSESADARRSLAPIVAPVCAAGLATVVAAGVSFATTAHSTTVVAGLLAFFGASLLADRFPVPVDDLDANGLSLAFVFGLSAIVLFGWAAGVLVVSATPAVMQLLDRRPPIRIAYNSFAFALTAASAGLVVAAIGGDSPAKTAARVVAATYVCYVVDVLLITAVVARATRASWPALVGSSVRRTILPFTLMGSAVLTLVVLWQRAPFLSVALVGPLLAIQLYQRALLQALRAVRLALTDPLIGLGNHRHFHERLARELEQALRYVRPLAPEHARERDELPVLVDGALYWAKEYGKNRVRVFRPDVVELAVLKRLASAGDRAARLRAAASLASAVDQRDAYSGSHSQRVAPLAVRLAAPLGLSRDELELTQLAASLHDVGKLALPEDLLRKAAPLSEPEWASLKQHAQIGFRMLESLGVDPVAEWVLHHHERWDGMGYPD